MKCNNNNNISIADELEDIVSSLSKLDTNDIPQSVIAIEKEISRLDSISQVMNVPELRALAHWMMLNIEFEPSNEDQINSLLEQGSYYNWMDILSMLLREYNQSLLPEIYKTLTEPNWLVKPSAPLLRNLAGWIEISRFSPETLTNDRISSENNNDNLEDSTLESSQLSSEVDLLHPHVFEEVDLSILEKNYCSTSDFKEISKQTSLDSSSEIIEEPSSSYAEIEIKEENNEKFYVDENEIIESSNDDLISAATAIPEEVVNDFSYTNEKLVINEEEIIEPSNDDLLSATIAIPEEVVNDPSDKNEELIVNEDEIIEPSDNDLISTTSAMPEEVMSDFSDKDEKLVISEDEIITPSNDDSTATDLTMSEEASDFSDEINDIVMTLSSISALSKNVLDDTDNYIAELQRLDMLADISGYSKISNISHWCQQNLTLFAEKQSEESRLFIESGECWTWIELTNLSLEEPENISHISELSMELSRDEWLEPLAVEDLQELLLFLRNPENNLDEVLDNEINSVIDNTHTEENNELITEDSEITESEEFTLRWDDDVHPELLEVYFEETSGQITEISQYLKDIGSQDTSKEERQHASRIAHTIKGGSAVVGITALAQISHKLEVIFDYSINNTLPDEVNTLLNDSSNCLGDLYKAVLDKEPVPTDFSIILSKLTQYAESLDEEKVADDLALELSAPVLPDFITKQNANTPKNDDEPSVEDSLTDDLSTEIEDVIAANTNIDIIETSDDIEIESTTNKTETDESLTKELLNEYISIETDNDKEDKLENSKLPTLNQNEDLSDFSAELDDIVMTLVTTDLSTEDTSLPLDNYISELQRLDMLAEISGFSEVSKVSNWCQNNLKLISQDPNNASSEFISSGESWSWIELISASLSDPEEISHLSTLSSELMRDEWIVPLDINDLQNLLLSLKASENQAQAKEENFDEQHDTSNAPESKNDTVKIITWDDDVHPELLSVYLQETSEQVTKIAELLHLISKGKADKEQQQQAARIAHTIKGASGVVGITEIVDFTHKLEDILDYAVDNDLLDETSELLAESSDCLESLFEAVQEKGTTPEEFASVLAKLTSYADSIIEDNDPISDESLELDMPELPDFITNNDPDSTFDENITDEASQITTEDITNEDDTFEELQELDNPESSNLTANDLSNPVIENEDTKAIQMTMDELSFPETSPSLEDSSKQSNETSTNLSSLTESTIRVPTALINKLLNLAGELVTASSQVSDKVENTIATSVQIKDQDKRVHKMLNELSTTIYKQEKDQINMLSSMQNNQFDTLEMDTYNELHSVAGLLTESILDSETFEESLKQQLNEIHNDLRHLDQLNEELSETILSSRMESLNTLVPRLERIVRQTCRKTGKKAKLVVTGNDINIDTDILNGLVDPLLHLLRNAIDHGIETPEARKANNKSKSGQIHLNFSRQGNFIHMKLKDDGAGINSEKIYQHAIEKGVITPDQEYSKSDVLKLILQPGFSTQSSVSDISGRGVGMDVVNKGVEQLRGSLIINSELNKGTSFDIKIPLTLVTSSTLLVSVAGNQVAIPTDSIEQLFYLSPEDVLTRKGEHYIRHQGKELAIESLAGILGWTVQSVDFSQAQTLLLVNGEKQLHAVYIDKIIHSREVVIKSLAHYIDSSNGVIGACHLTDGAVAPVLNLPQLLSLNEKSSYTIKQTQEDDFDSQSLKTTPQILVVDDSLSNRKALSLIIEKTDYDVITAVDGLDALNIMNEKHIDLVFTDLEMPRMTGLELTQAIRSWDEKKHTPIVMITSRSTNKHRQLANKAGVDDYLTKPVGTETLLESMDTWLKQTALA